VRVEAPVVAGGVVHGPLAAVGLQEGVLAVHNIAVTLLRGVLDVPCVAIAHAVLVRILGVVIGVVLLLVAAVAPQAGLQIRLEVAFGVAPEAARRAGTECDG